MKHKTKGGASIKWRIFALFALFTAVMLALLWVFQVVFLDSFYKVIKRREIDTAMQAVRANLDGEEFEEFLAGLGEKYQMSILLSNRFGNEAYMVAQPNNLFYSLNLVELYEITKKSDNGYYMEFTLSDLSKAMGITTDVPKRSQKKELTYILSTSIAYQENGKELLIVLGATLTPLDATVNTLRVQLFVVTGVMLLLALLLALFLSKRISKPIVSINASAKALAQGNYGAAFDETGYREIAELGATLNYAARELGKVERLQRDLVANISHDLRTPLTMITGYSEIMRDLPGENTPENVQVIIDEASRLTSLVNDVLDLSKLQSGTLTLQKSVYNLTNSTREILKRYNKLTDYQVTFSAEQEVFVSADELKISQVVYNLVNNALTYTGQDKLVALRQVVENGKVRVEVSDTGEGIPAEKLGDIWERYYKVDKAHKRAQVGTGLGLSIVRTILDLHGGRYGVKSQIGVGSTFWFELDEAQPDEGRTPEQI